MIFSYLIVPAVRKSSGRFAQGQAARRLADRDDGEHRRPDASYKLITNRAATSRFGERCSSLVAASWTEALEDCEAAKSPDELLTASRRSGRTSCRDHGFGLPASRSSALEFHL
jgi:hypothetical protein